MASADPLGQVGAGGAAQVAEDPGPGLGLGPELRHLVVERGEPVVVAVELDQAPAALVEQPQHVVEARTVLAQQRRQLGATGLDRLEVARRVRVEAAEVARQP
jgi:hypothetical protein